MCHRKIFWPLKVAHVVESFTLSNGEDCLATYDAYHLPIPDLRTNENSTETLTNFRCLYRFENRANIQERMAQSNEDGRNPIYPMNPVSPVGTQTAGKTDRRLRRLRKRRRTRMLRHLGECSKPTRVQCQLGYGAHRTPDLWKPDREENRPHGVHTTGDEVTGGLEGDNRVGV